MFVINTDSNSQGVHGVNNIDFINVNTYYNMYLPSYYNVLNNTYGTFNYCPAQKGTIYGMAYNLIDQQQYFPNIVTCNNINRGFALGECNKNYSNSLYVADICMISLKTFEGGEIVGKTIKPAYLMKYRGMCCPAWSRELCGNIMLGLLHTNGVIDTLYCKNCHLISCDNGVDHIFSDIGTICTTAGYTAGAGDKLFLRFYGCTNTRCDSNMIASVNYDTGELYGYINSMDSLTRTSPIFQISID